MAKEAGKTSSDISSVITHVNSRRECHIVTATALFMVDGMEFSLNKYEIQMHTQAQARPTTKTNQPKSRLEMLQAFRLGERDRGRCIYWIDNKHASVRWMSSKQKHCLGETTKKHTPLTINPPSR